MSVRFFVDRCVPLSVTESLYLGEHPKREHYSWKLFLAEAHRIRIKE